MFFFNEILQSCFYSPLNSTHFIHCLFALQLRWRHICIDWLAERRGTSWEHVSAAVPFASASVLPRNELGAYECRCAVRFCFSTVSRWG